MEVVPSLANSCISCVTKEIGLLEDEVSKMPPHIKSYILPLLCKRGIINENNIGKFVHRQTSELELSDCEISDRGLEQIQACAGLQVLNLNSNKGTRDAVTSEGLQEVFRSCKMLRSVHLKRCVNVDDACLSALAQNCRALTHVNLHGCDKIGDVGLKAVTESSAHLESMDLSRTSVSEEAIVEFATEGACKGKLQELNLSYCQGTTDHAVYQLIKHCQRLKMLMLHGCPLVTGESRELLSQQQQQQEQGERGDARRQTKFKQLTWTIAF